LKLGAATLTDPGLTIFELLDTYSHLNLKYVEIRCEWPYLDPQSPNKKYLLKLRETIESLGMRPLLHSSYIDVNLASFNDISREASLRRTLRCLEIARILDAEYVTIHMGYLHGDHHPHRYNIAKKLGVLSLIKITEKAHDIGAKVCIENKERSKNRHLLTTPEEILEFLEIADDVAPNTVFITYDVGHANTWNHDLLSFFKKLRDRIRVVHLHDNDGSSDQHLALGRGNIEFQRLIPKMYNEVKNAIFILEVHDLEGIRESVKVIERILEGG